MAIDHMQLHIRPLLYLQEDSKKWTHAQSTTNRMWYILLIEINNTSTDIRAWICKRIRVNSMM